MKRQSASSPILGNAAIIIDTRHQYITGVNKPACPYCKQSKGELLVNSVLSSLYLEFISKYKLAFLLGHRYDFPFIYNGDNWLVEYDGLQHFEEIAHFH